MKKILFVNTLNDGERYKVYIYFNMYCDIRGIVKIVLYNIDSEKLLEIDLIFIQYSRCFATRLSLNLDILLNAIFVLFRISIERCFTCGNKVFIKYLFIKYKQIVYRVCELNKLIQVDKFILYSM